MNASTAVRAQPDAPSPQHGGDNSASLTAADDSGPAKDSGAAEKQHHLDHQNEDDYPEGEAVQT